MAITKIQAGALPAGVVTVDAIADTSITHAKLHTDMDLSAKTVVLPTLSTLDVSGNITVAGTVDGVDIQTLNTAVIANTAKVTNYNQTKADIEALGIAASSITGALPAISGAALTDVAKLSVGTSAPSTPSAGDQWFDTTSGVNAMKVWSGSSWGQMSNKFSATGGTESVSAGYKYHTFTSSGTFTIISGTYPVECLVVGGGGGGGGSHGGGGGAGGYRVTDSIVMFNKVQHAIIVGAGAAQLGANGVGASGSSSVISTVTSLGGGGGGYENVAGTSGSSGGGGGGKTTGGGSGTAGQGNSGGAGANSVGYGGGGGGGASGVGGVGGSAGGGGGAGTTWLNGSTYAGGGGGSSYLNDSVGAGGAGGGGSGGRHGSSVLFAAAGSVNTGGGGGGNWSAAGAVGAAGGSGVVIIRYPI